MLGVPCFLIFSSSTLLRPRQNDDSNNCKKRASTLDLELMDISAQFHMQSIPTAPLLGLLLTPLSGQSSPSSSFFLDQTIDDAGKKSHKKYKLEDVSSLLRLDDKEGEVDGIDEGRPPEKSYWSDDSDIDDDEYVEDQTDDEGSSGESSTSANDVNAKDQEADGQAFKVGKKHDMAAPVVLEGTGGEEAELGGNKQTGSACLLNGETRGEEAELSGKTHARSPAS